MGGFSVDDLRNLESSLKRTLDTWQKSRSRITAASATAFESQLRSLRPYLWNGAGQQAGVETWLQSSPPAIANSSEALYWRVQLRIAADLPAHDLKDAIATSELGDHHPDLIAALSELFLRSGEPEVALRYAQSAVSISRTPHTLINLGRMLGVSRPIDGVQVIREGLRNAERRGDPYFIAWACSALAARLNGLGRFVDAVEYARWGRRIYAAHSLHVPHLLDGLVNETSYGVLLSIESEVELVEQLHTLEHHIKSTSAGRRQVLDLTAADIRLALGEVQRAERVYREQWSQVTIRGPVGSAANQYARALLELNRPSDALKVGDAAVRLTAGLPHIYKRRARLAHAIALSIEFPLLGVDALRRSLDDFKEPLLVPGLLQAGLYLIRALRAMDRFEEASTTAEFLRPYVGDLGPFGIRYLGGPQELFSQPVIDVRQSGDILRLEFLGRNKAYKSGRLVTLRQRFMDVLAVLVQHPEGMGAEKLALAVYGESTPPSRIRVDISKLRAFVPIGSRPYRISVPYEADFIQVRQCIERGKLREAVERYVGPLLPYSCSPWVQDERSWLEQLLIESVIASGEVDLIYSLALRLDSHPELWDKVRQLLPEEDPRTTTALTLLKKALS